MHLHSIQFCFRSRDAIRTLLRFLLILGFSAWICRSLAGDVSVPSHWAFQPLQVSTPQIHTEGQGMGDSPIDGWIQAQLDRLGLKANAVADVYTLFRRIHFDLTGLPPTPEDIRQFIQNPTPEAYAQSIDRLLASPAYGERWGRFWLDLARYADTNGADENMAHPNAWRYRDYVIRSLNQDKPFDQFLREQIAGDLLPSTGDLDADQDQIIATGFLALGPKMLAEQDKEKLLIDVVDEQIDVISQTFLGLTVSCARCHDHKFDPIAQADYFAMAGIFRSTKTLANTDHVSRWVESVIDLPENSSIMAKYQEEQDQIRSDLAAIETDLEAENREKRLKELKDQLKKLETAGPPLPRTMAVTEGEPQDLPVHVRGNHLTPKSDSTARGVIPLFEACLPSPSVAATTSGRLELADWLADPKHPLTARVFVNRVWQRHFGEGLVRSPSNFGLRGDEPTHPELLDWLAGEFIRNGWSMKKLHRTILLSDAYRRSSHPNSFNASRDPDNLWLWRQNRRRLEAEPIRDALLFVSGQLDLSGSGPLSGLEKNQSYYRSDPASFEKRTRAIYLPVVRAAGYEMFATFDAADPAAHHQQRASTIVPSQALFLLNNELSMQSARALAERIAELFDEHTVDGLQELYLCLLGRPARVEELELLERALQPAAGSSTTSPTSPTSPTTAEWERICRVLLAANEFVYVQ